MPYCHSIWGVSPEHTENGETNINDREAIMAVFKAVGALAERLTGERLKVDVETEAGVISIVSDGQQLGERHQEAAAMRPSHQPSNHSTRQSEPA